MTGKDKAIVQSITQNRHNDTILEKSGGRGSRDAPQRSVLLLRVELFDGGHDPGLGRNELLPGNTELEEARDGVGETAINWSVCLTVQRPENVLLEPKVLVFGVGLGVLLEALVLGEDIVGTVQMTELQPGFGSSR